MVGAIPQAPGGERLDAVLRVLQSGQPLLKVGRVELHINGAAVAGGCACTRAQFLSRACEDCLWFFARIGLLLGARVQCVNISLIYTHETTHTHSLTATRTIHWAHKVLRIKKNICASEDLGALAVVVSRVWVVVLFSVVFAVCPVSLMHYTLTLTRTREDVCKINAFDRPIESGRVELQNTNKTRYTCEPNTPKMSHATNAPHGRRRLRQPQLSAVASASSGGIVALFG